MNESTPSRTTPPQAARNPRRWLVVRPASETGASAVISGVKVAHDDRSSGEDPRTVLIIRDLSDPAVRSDLEPNDAFDLPRSIVEIQQNDRRLAVHLAERQAPRHRHA